MNAEDAVRIVAIGLAVYGFNYWRGRHDRKKDKELQEKFRNRTPEQIKKDDEDFRSIFGIPPDK